MLGPESDGAVRGLTSARPDRLPTEPMRAVLYIAATSGLDEREDIMSIMLGDCMRDESRKRKDMGVGGI